MVTMSKPWKIVLCVLGVVMVLVIGAVGVAVYFGAQFVGGMRVVAEEIYGGPMPSKVMPIMGLDFKEQQQKMAVFMDTGSNTAMVVIEGPAKHQGKAPFSELDLQEALSGYGSSQEMSSTFEGVSEGKPASFMLGKETIHTVKFSNKEGKLSELGILNLDKGQMIFVATGDGVTEGNSDSVANFLGNMPALKNDSHLATSATPEGAKSPTP
jgi:hypothetical protein